MHISVDTAVCIGTGQCAMSLPEVFDQDDDGLVVLLDEQPPPELHAELHDATGRCPVQAITAAAG